MSDRRNLDIVLIHILKICKNGANKNRIIYKGNLNSITTTKYLGILIKRGFIETTPNGAWFIYKTTPKGQELQEKLEQFKGTMDQLYTYTHNTMQMA